MRSRLVRITPARLALAALGLAGFDWGSQLAGDSTFPGGPLDECAHLFTTLLILWALGRRISERFMVPALFASVLIDLDHVPARLGWRELTEGTPRPYTHSLLTVAVVLLGALLWRRRREVLLGVAIGLAIHFWRDLSEPGSGVALLWPFSDHSFSLPHASYVLVMIAVVGVGAFRCRVTRPVRVGGGRPRPLQHRKPARAFGRPAGRKARRGTQD